MADIGVSPKIYINNVLASVMGENNYAFIIKDSIYQVFPEAELAMTDLSGLFLEYGVFTRGAPLGITLEMDDDILESKFIISHRDNITQPVKNSLGGNVKISGVHESYTKNRARRSAYYNKKASDIIKDLFPDADVEDTSAKIAVYQKNEDSYEWVSNVLLDLADSSTKTPFVFFRDLQGKLFFKSIGDLAKQSPVMKLSLEQRMSGQDVKSAMNSFMPFDERLTDVLDKFLRTTGWVSGLNYKTEDVTVSDSVEDCLSVMSDPVKKSPLFLGRQFNPDMDYAGANHGLQANALRKGFLTDKALVSTLFNSKLVSGTVVDAEVFLQSGNGERRISEAFSGKWLIEQSRHVWSGNQSPASTTLVLSRSSYKPVKDSLLLTKGYKGK